MKKSILFLIAILFSTQLFSQTPPGATAFRNLKVTEVTLSTNNNDSLVMIGSDKILRLKPLSELGGGISEVTGVIGEITVANGTTAPVIGISSTYTTARNAYADGKISSTITDGVTTSAPNEDAVFDALALKAPINNASFTGTFTLPNGALSITSGSASNYIRADGVSASFTGSVRVATVGTVTPSNIAIASSDMFTTIVNKTQGQIDNTVKLTGNQTVAGIKTFSSSPIVPTATTSGNAVNLGQLQSGYIPLSGTPEDNPITGDLVVDNEVKITNVVCSLSFEDDILYFRNTYNNSIFSASSTGFTMVNDNGTDPVTSLIVTNPEVLVSGAGKGIVGNILFDKQNDPNAYAQIGDIGTGWATYGDTVYTSGSPFSITSGTTSTLPNNAGTVINTQLPTGVTSFYDSSTNKFTPENDGDYYTVTIRFKAQTTAAVGGYFDFGIDIGGALGVQFKETKIFAKGAGIEHNFSIVVPCYTASTFVANGGLVKITSGLGTMTIYDINFQFDRVHKSK